MKKLLLRYQTTLVLFLFACTLSHQTLQGQNRLYALVEYMKTAPGKEWQYTELESKFWKPVHQARINQGEIIAWMLYHIRYTADGDPYNYATVTIYADPSQLENKWTVDPIKVHPDKDVERLIEETDNSRTLVIKNLLFQQNGVVTNPTGPDPKFLEVDYMAVQQGTDQQYLQLEDELWKPVHQALLSEGQRAGWSLWGRMYPSGYGLDYQYITVNDFATFDQIGQTNFEKTIRKCHPKLSLEEFEKRTNDSRVLVKSELWELLDAAY